MNTLAVDTSGPSVSVAIHCEGACLFECTQANGLTHSQSLMPMVEQALAVAALQPAQLDLLAVVVGPGSFTGVRIGVETIKAMAQALDKPCIGVDALEAFAANLAQSECMVCPIQDARAGQVYGAAFHHGVRCMEDVAEKLPVYLARIAALGETLLFVGDGVSRYRAEIEAALPHRARFASSSAMLLRASCVAELATKRMQEAVEYDQLLPFYLRAPQAERERAAKEAQHG